jgi:copper chaperone CopZ
MKRALIVLSATLAALSLGVGAQAGGSMCTGKSEGAAKHVSAEGSHCMGGASAQAHGEQCTITANQAVMAFAVPGAECDACVKTIQRAAMAQKGIACAHVNLDTHTAYIVAEKGVSRNAIAKAIKDAGFRCSFKAEGPKVKSELMKTIAAGGPAACCAKKEKDKV